MLPPEGVVDGRIDRRTGEQYRKIGYGFWESHLLGELNCRRLGLLNQTQAQIDGVCDQIDFADPFDQAIDKSKHHSADLLRGEFFAWPSPSRPHRHLSHAYGRLLSRTILHCKEDSLNGGILDRTSSKFHRSAVGKLFAVRMGFDDANVGWFGQCTPRTRID